MIASEHAPLIILFAAFMQCNTAIATPSGTTKDRIIVERHYPLMRHGNAGYRAIVYGGLLVRYPLQPWRSDLIRREISPQIGAKQYSTTILNTSPRSSFPMMGGMYG